MSTNVSVIQKLEGLLARVTKRSAEPRQAARQDAPTTVPPPLEPVVIASPQPYVASPDAELELISVDDATADTQLPVVEAAAASVDPVDAPRPNELATESVAVPTPEPVYELHPRSAAAPAAALADGRAAASALASEARTAPPPPAAPYAADELAPISEPAQTPAPTGHARPGVVPMPTVVAEAAPIVVATPPTVAAETAPVVVATPPSVAAPAMPVVVDADTGDGSVHVAVDVPVVHEAQATPPSSPPAPAEVSAVAKTLDGSHTEPPPAMFADDVTVIAASDPRSLLEEDAAPDPTPIAASSEATAPAEAAAPSSSRRVRTVPPGDGAALSHESGAHLIPDRASLGELALSVQGSVYARAPLPAHTDVAAFVAAASAPAPATFGALLDDSLRLGE